MNHFKIENIIVPSEFIITKEVNSIMVENTHYVISFDEKFNFVIVIKRNGKDVNGCFLQTSFFIDYHSSYKELSLESFNKLKIFL